MDEVADSFGGKRFVLRVLCWASVEKMAAGFYTFSMRMLVYKEETSSVTRIQLSGSGPSFWSWRRKWVVSLM